MIQPGVGYTYTNDKRGSTLVIDTVAPEPNHPFRLFEDSTAEGVAVVRISPGTFNNTLPTVNGAEIGAPEAYLPKPAGSGFFYLEIPASEETGDPFPADVPSVEFGSSVPSNNAVTAYVALAKAELIAETSGGGSPPVLVISQLVTGSLWGERFECGSQLDYWFSHI
jgi:hypothetical protein